MDDDIAEEVFEADIIETDINELCRICGSTSDSPLVPIFEESGLAEDLAGKVMQYLPIKISEDDILPVKICANCTNGILTWHLLYECCVEADHRFKAMLDEERKTESPKRSKEKQSVDNHVSEVHLNEASQDDEPEMEDVMFLKAEFGPEDEQYLEDETRLADGELEPRSDDRQPVKSSTFSQPVSYSNAYNIDIKSERVEDTEDPLPQDNMNFKENEIYLLESSISETCDICNKMFLTQTEMLVHRAQHDCNICFKTFKNYATMISHRKIHDSNSTNYNCPICEFDSYRKYNLQLHIKSHVNDFPCKICCNSFNSEQLLENHKAKHEKGELAQYWESSKKVICKECDMNFDSKFKLYFHTLEKHSSENERFTCSKCSRVFETHTMLKNHEKSHSDRCYKCKECGKIFSKLKNYNEHQNTHLDSRPFQCDICLQRFNYSSNLSQHRSIHKGAKNFVCHYCDKKFTRSNTLNLHLKSHRNERNYSCEYCDSSFVQSSTLYKHKRALHRKCEQCSQIVGDRKQWQIHAWNGCGGTWNTGTTDIEPDIDE